MACLPPASNWYCDSLASEVHTDDEGVRRCLVAYAAARTSVVILDATQSTQLRVLSTFALSSHPDRVTGVAFNTEATVLATSCADGRVRLWNARSRARLVVLQDAPSSLSAASASSKTPKRRRKGAPASSSTTEEMTCVTFCAGSTHVVAGTSRGALIAWSVVRHGDFQPSEPVSLVLPGSSVAKFGPVTCLRATGSDCGDHGNLVAAGYRGGVVHIVDVVRNETVQLLRGHEEEVLSLAWSPLASTSSQTQLMLASGARDRTVRVWNATTGVQLASTPVPHKGASKDERHFSHQQQLQRVWSAVLWCDSHRLFISSLSGDVYAWSPPCCATLSSSSSSVVSSASTTTTKSASKKGGSAQLTHLTKLSGTPHSRIVFSMCRTGVDPERTEFLSTSMDRRLVVWDGTSSVGALSTIGSHVSAIDVSPVDGKRVAVASGDACIRLWSRTGATGSGDCVVLWRGLQNKVAAVAWHPLDESVLAFGMEDGRVGTFDVFSHQAWFSDVRHGNSCVYTVCWSRKGESSQAMEVDKGGEEEQEEIGLRARAVLWSCGGDGMVVRHARDEGVRACNVNELLVGPRDDNDESSPSMGSGGGGAVMLSKRSDVRFAYDVPSQVALASTTGSIDVYNALADERGPWRNVAQLCGHTRRVNALAWERNGRRLASGTDDGHIRVHLVPTAASSDTCIQSVQAVAVLRGHSRSVTDLDWCSMGLASSSYDGTVQVWNPTTSVALDNDAPEQFEGTANFRGHVGTRVSTVRWQSHHAHQQAGMLVSAGDDQCVRVWSMTEQPHRTPPELPSLKRKARRADGESDAASGNGGGGGGTLNGATVVEVAQKEAMEKEQKRRKVQASESAKKRTVKDTQSRVPASLDVAHASMTEIESAVSPSTLWMYQGNVLAALRAARESLTSDLVAWSASAGEAVWRACARLYAAQLQAQSRPHDAVGYLLAVGDVTAAIEAYRSAGLDRDAMLVERMQVRHTVVSQGDALVAEWTQEKVEHHDLVHGACSLRGRSLDPLLDRLARWECEGGGTGRSAAGGVVGALVALARDSNEHHYRALLNTPNVPLAIIGAVPSEQLWQSLSDESRACHLRALVSCSIEELQITDQVVQTMVFNESLSAATASTNARLLLERVPKGTLLAAKIGAFLKTCT